MNAHLVDLHDMRVLQRRDRLRLLLEARKHFRACMLAVQDHLQGHQPVQTNLPSFIHDAHTTSSKFALDLIAAHNLARIAGRT